jgi:hypothetical protein
LILVLKKLLKQKCGFLILKNKEIVDELKKALKQKAKHCIDLDAFEEE